MGTGQEFIPMALNGLLNALLRSRPSQVRGGGAAGGRAKISF